MPARSIRTRPACCSSASVGRRVCCGSSPRCRRPTRPRSCSGGRPRRSTPRERRQPCTRCTSTSLTWSPRRRRSPVRSCRCPRWSPPSRSTAGGCTSSHAKGIEVEREPRPVTVHRFDVDSTPDPLVYRVEVECSSGTYVRSLAADLGHALGGGAHLRALRRTAVGSFTESEANPVDTLVLQPPAVALRDFASTVVGARGGRRDRAREGARRRRDRRTRRRSVGRRRRARACCWPCTSPPASPTTVKPAVVLMPAT